ncbi:FAD-dependent oxidoreductase [Roseomonas sp. CCTCC AB2023176]|uniref:FAD-dependent oxidoreductase n=1 Tax=Roseomonas sp. CCTCC AB2023176 TaxID=3342640 RepID=UPI0035D673C2
MPESRVIVVGAGPVGLVAATCLAEAGIPVTVVEAEEALPDGIRASTFHSPTLDMLDRFGVTDALIEQGLVCPTWQYRDREAGPVATFDLTLLKDDTNHPYRLQCEQWRLTRLLRDRLAGNPDVTFTYGLKAAAVRQDDSGVTLTATDAGEVSHIIRGSFLIGADGARSAVRKSLGIGFDGMTIPELFLTVSTPYPFHEAMPDLANIAYLSDPDEWLVLLRNRSRWRVLVPADPEEPEDLMLSDARVEQRMQAVLPKDGPYEIVHRTAYRVHERVAEHYAMGRVFLAGDAAHVNNPLGGMGMNGGIHDAFNVSEKLIMVWRGAPLETMGRYERQRRKVALDVVQQQALRNREMLNQRDPAVRKAHQDSMRGIVEDREKHHAFLLRTSMIQSLRDLEKVA